MHPFLSMLLIAGVAADGSDHGRLLRHATPERVVMTADSVAVPMTRLDGRIVVGVMLNGKGPFPFIFDTGAQGGVMDLAFAREQGLELGEHVKVQSPGGRGLPGSRVTIRELAIGGLTLEGLTSIAFEGLPFARTPDSPRGVLSPYALDGLLVAIDYRGERLVFRRGALPEPDGREVFGWDAGARLPELPAAVAGEPVTLHLDTGSSSGVSLPTSFAATLPLDGPLVDMGYAKTVDQVRPVLGAPLAGSMTIGRYTLERPTIRFVDMARGVGNLGGAVLGQFAITIDPANARLRLDGPGDGMIRESGERKPRYGIQLLALEANPIEVRVVDAGSPAETAGLRAGDRIVRMNGRPIEEVSVDERLEALRASPLTVSVERGGESIEITMALP